MFTFIYPKDDWTAAETIVKAEALAASKGIKVYSPPKNYRRDVKEIGFRLRKTEQAVFLACEAVNIDEDTEYEINSLLERNIPFYFILPYDLLLNVDLQNKKNVKVSRYERNNNDELSNILGEVFTQKDNNVPSIFNKTILIIIGILLLIILLNNSK